MGSGGIAKSLEQASRFVKTKLPFSAGFAQAALTGFEGGRYTHAGLVRGTRVSQMIRSSSRRGPQLATKIVVALLMVGTFAGVFGFLYYSNKPAAAPKERQILFFTVSHDRICREMEPVVGTLINAGLNVQRIDIDAEPALKAKYGVTLLPCYIVLEGDKEVSRETGARDEAALRAKLEVAKAS